MDRRLLAFLFSLADLSIAQLSEQLLALSTRLGPYLPPNLTQTHVMATSIPTRIAAATEENGRSNKGNNASNAKNATPISTIRKSAVFDFGDWFPITKSDMKTKSEPTAANDTSNICV